MKTEKRCVHRGCEQTETESIHWTTTAEFGRDVTKILQLCTACYETFLHKHIQTRDFVAGNLRFVEEAWIAEAEEA